MAINLGLDTQLQDLRSASTTGSGWVAAFVTLIKAALGKFGDTAEKDLAPGPNRVIVVGDDGKVAAEALGNLGVNADMPWVFHPVGEGTRVSTLRNFRIHVEGNKRWGEVDVVYLPKPGTPGGTPENPSEPPFNDPAP